MCGWSDDNVKFYLLGTPIIWWGGFASIFVIIGMALFYVIRQRRLIYDHTPSNFEAIHGR
jgi:dolichyl-phosphate-mannose-protein mannosyltransferase